jgi:GntR family transcriptional regulator
MNPRANRANRCFDDEIFTFHHYRAHPFQNHLRNRFLVGIVFGKTSGGRKHADVDDGLHIAPPLAADRPQGQRNRMSTPLPLEQLQSVRGGPLYVKLRKMIEDAVASGRLKHGDALPAERDIAEAADISRVTVRKAIDELVEEGLLVRRRGSGTFVVKPVPRMQQPLSQLTSFTEDMRRRGMVAGSRWLSRGLFYPTAEETMMLGLVGGARVARIDRLRTANDMPIALERTSLPDDLLPDPDKIEDSLYLCLLDAGIRPVRANQRISAVLLKDEETKLLGVPPGSAALSVQRIAYLETGRVMEMSRALYRSDAYDLVAELGIGSPMKPQD